MNRLYIGAKRKALLNDFPEEPCLVVDNGPVIDQLSKRARRFDPLKHSLNPLRDISYRTACDIVSVIECVYPGGENTLTRQNTSMQLLAALMDSPKKLDGLISDTKETKDAFNKVQRLLLSPVLKPVLTRPPSLNFSMKGTILARLDRATLGNFDSLFIGNLLASRYPGTVVITDFGFYAASFHENLIEQGRLVACVNSLAEIPEKMRNRLLTSSELIPSRCTYQDAVALAEYLCPHLPHTNQWNAFIEECTEKRA
jgi:hypothetical protein